jgi:hypothetical protein
MTNDEHLANIASNIIHRKSELYNYNVNIDNYTAMLDCLPTGDWPESISALKPSLPEHFQATYSGTVARDNPDLFELWDTYMYRDRVRTLLQTEKAAYRQVLLVHDVLVRQIPASELDSRLTAATAQINATAVKA